jgi:hypothetical protein
MKLIVDSRDTVLFRVLVAFGFSIGCCELNSARSFLG